jgi:hypothetical protein
VNFNAVKNTGSLSMTTPIDLKNLHSL